MNDSAKRTAKIYNYSLFDPLSTEGLFDIPRLQRVNVVPEVIIPFNYALSFQGDRERTGVHFFIDDYQFERVWHQPEKYLNVLRKFQCVFTPDWSMYLDFPAAALLWNHYRKQVIGQFFQNNQIQVVPTVGWGFPNSYSFCFQGIPTHGTIAVSTMVGKSNVYRKIWQDGMTETVRRLKPEQILAYGQPIEFDPVGAEVVWFRSEHLDRMRKIRKKENGPRTNFLVQNPRLVYYVANMMGIPKSEWEDFFQETILASLQTKDDYCEEKGKLESWCRKFVELTALNYKRKLEK